MQHGLRVIRDIRVNNRLRKQEWKVAPVGLRLASQLVRRFHYAKSHSNQYTALHGLFMVYDVFCALPYGLCWWIPLPSKSAAQSFHSDYRNVLGLSRMVLTPDAPPNSASFMLSRSIKLLPERYHTLATYADTYQGHTGRVYLASNWQYLGLSDDSNRIWINSSGESVSTRQGKNSLTKAEMQSMGYTFIGYYPKHRYVYHRYEPILSKQLSFFDLIQE